MIGYKSCCFTNNMQNYIDLKLYEAQEILLYILERQ